MRRDVDRELVVKLYVEDKKSTVEIGRLVGLWPGAISSILRTRGVKPRTAKQAHRVKWPEGRTGARAGRWKGGRRVANRAGYICIYAPEHPHATRDGYVMEHRLVVEKAIGRVLSPKEIVHHRNGIKDHNNIENLELVSSRGEHVRKHFLAVRRVHELEAFIRSLGLTPPPD